MASEIATIQSLKAVDAWIDVINANINGGVRTAFKSSRLKFGGSNTDVARAGTSTSLPLQFPEPGLTTTNTVIDWTQGAITASTENTHLAIQGEGYFMLIRPDMVSAAGMHNGAPNGDYLLTRDGEFHTDSRGLLVTSFGWYLVCGPNTGNGFFPSTDGRCVYNDLDTTAGAPALTSACKLSTFLSNDYTGATSASGAALGVTAGCSSLFKITGGKQNLTYTSYGSTVYDFGYIPGVNWGDPSIQHTGSSTSDATILSKSLEASNASMTQSVPELSLAQKLFSALTKVLQTKQTNVDGVLNLVR
jgi:flagellar hook protein FlgE